jgi:hypothetical protein
MVRNVGGTPRPFGDDRRKGISDNRDTAYCGKCGNKILKSQRFCGKCGNFNTYLNKTIREKKKGYPVNMKVENLAKRYPDPEFNRTILELNKSNGDFQKGGDWVHILDNAMDISDYGGYKVRVSGDSKKDAIDVYTRAYPVLKKYGIKSKIGWNNGGVQKGKLLTSYIPKYMIDNKQLLRKFLLELESSMDGYRGNMPISGDHILGKKGVLSYRFDGGEKYVSNDGVTRDIPNDKLKGII